MSLREVEKLLADYKQHAGITDPPAATGTQLQSQLASSLTGDPVLIE